MRGQGGAISYAEFTVDRYNRTVRTLVRSTAFELLIVFASSAAIFLAPIRGAFGSPLRYAWLLFVPLVAIGLAGKLMMPFKLKEIDVKAAQTNAVDDRVIHVIVTTGANVSAVANTVSSINYWYREVKRKYNVGLKYEIEVVTEEWAAQRIKRALPTGVRLVAVPQGFRTENGAKYKARALEYARLTRSLENPHKTWLYHHDDETTIGEDTVLGILDFIANRRGDVGVNIIVYPVAWKGGVVGHLETVRSALDAVNASLTPSLLKHGSGFLIRASLENAIGWDFRDSLAEDFIFHAKASKLARYGLMRGFAYELSPPGLKDMLKQRRRWFVGKLEAYLNGSVDLGSSFKEALELMENVTFLPVNLAAGIVGAHYIGVMEPPLLLFISLISGYYIIALIKDAFVSHMYYLGFSPVDFFPHAFYAEVGLLLESLAPWYAFVSRERGYFVMNKQVRLNFRY